MGKYSFFVKKKNRKNDAPVTTQKVKENARETFVQGQMKGAMIDQFKIILEKIYNPMPYMLEPYKEIVGHYAAQDFFFSQVSTLQE